jgi:hypothetical protein
VRRSLSLIVAVLALGLAALPASALASGDATATPGGGDSRGGALPHAGALGVSAALDSCGIAEAAIVCKIDATFNQVPDAQYYTSSVTRPDGSVVDYGSVGEGSTSLWVPYAGDGDYVVSVSAYGVVKKDKPPAVVAEGRSKAAKKSSNGDGTATTPDATATEGRGTPDGTGATITPAPTCDRVPPPETGPSGPTGPTGSSGSTGASGTTGPSVGLEGSAASANDPAVTGVTSDQAVGLATQAELPQTVTDLTGCPDTVQATDGSCCPQDAGQ